MILKNKLQKEVNMFLGTKNDPQGKLLVKRIIEILDEISIDDAKQIIAEKFRKKDWADVLRDYSYGLGISKRISFEDLMVEVAEVYKKGLTN